MWIVFLAKTLSPTYLTGSPPIIPVGFDNFQFSTFNSQLLKRVVLLDCGVKANIIRNLLKRNVAVIRVPWNYDFNHLEYDGLFLSNGPGDPNTCDVAVRNIRKALDGDKPICGICMGNQLLAKAGGASIYKLKYGHRSHNQPVRMVGTEKCFITSQNHGYAVDNDTLGADWEPLFVNMNDGTNEGIRLKTKPFFSSQFHPKHVADRPIRSLSSISLSICFRNWDDRSKNVNE